MDLDNDFLAQFAMSPYSPTQHQHQGDDVIGDLDTLFVPGGDPVAVEGLLAAGGGWAGAAVVGPARAAEDLGELSPLDEFVPRGSADARRLAPRVIPAPPMVPGGTPLVGVPDSWRAPPGGAGGGGAAGGWRAEPDAGIDVPVAYARRRDHGDLSARDGVVRGEYRITNPYSSWASKLFLRTPVPVHQALEVWERGGSVALIQRDAPVRAVDWPVEFARGTSRVGGHAGTAKTFWYTTTGREYREPQAAPDAPDAPAPAQKAPTSKLPPVKGAVQGLLTGVPLDFYWVHITLEKGRLGRRPAFLMAIPTEEEEEEEEGGGGGDTEFKTDARRAAWAKTMPAEVVPIAFDGKSKQPFVNQGKGNGTHPELAARLLDASPWLDLSHEELLAWYEGGGALANMLIGNRKLAQSDLALSMGISIEAEGQPSAPAADLPSTLAAQSVISGELAATSAVELPGGGPMEIKRRTGAGGKVYAAKVWRRYVVPTVYQIRTSKSQGATPEDSERDKTSSGMAAAEIYVQALSYRDIVAAATVQGGASARAGVAATAQGARDDFSADFVAAQFDARHERAMKRLIEWVAVGGARKTVDAGDPARGLEFGTKEHARAAVAAWPRWQMLTNMRQPLSAVPASAPPAAAARPPSAILATQEERIKGAATDANAPAPGTHLEVVRELHAANDVLEKDWVGVAPDMSMGEALANAIMGRAPFGPVRAGGRSSTSTSAFSDAGTREEILAVGTRHLTIAPANSGASPLAQNPYSRHWMLGSEADTIADVLMGSRELPTGPYVKGKSNGDITMPERTPKHDVLTYKSMGLMPGGSVYSGSAKIDAEVAAMVLTDAAVVEAARAARATKATRALTGPKGGRKRKRKGGDDQ